MTTGKITGVNGNMITVRFEGAVAQNEVGYAVLGGQKLMAEIVRVHYPDIEDVLLQETLRAFYWLRDLSGIQKKPSTSEVLDWIQALQLSGIDPQRIADEIPYAGVLLKKNEDLDVLHRAKG